MRRIVSFLTVLTVLFSSTSCFQIFAEDAKLELPDYFIDKSIDNIGYVTPFKPYDKYGCMQNPPDFTWPEIKNAEKYDIIICSDEEMNDIKYSKYDLDYHGYNFPYTFDPGTYYWSVRYGIGDKVSDWSAPRRFRIDTDAYEFVIPDGEQLLNTVPTTHPRIWFTQDTVEDFREIAKREPGKNIADMAIKNADKLLEYEMPKEPEYKENPSREYINSVGGISNQIATNVSSLALAYIYSNDEKYARKAIDIMLEASTWDYENGATAHKNNDMANYQPMREFARAWDWVYNVMNPQERDTIATMIKGRFKPMEELVQTVGKTPYESHSWGMMREVLFVFIALMHDYPEFDEKYAEWVKIYIPNHVAMSSEDGSWSKGTGYWRYSVNRDKQHVDLLKEGGIIDLYQKAYHQNEYLMGLYMYPIGSWGSFGDESNIERMFNKNDILLGYAKTAQYTNNPIALWYSRQLSDVGTVESVASNYTDAILVADMDKAEALPPISLPRAHVFHDNGYVGMHSDLIDTDRISMYFRSGNYGSYNHMHADNNAFFIEAYGDRLAAKSGYYDSYHSSHDSGFTRKTYAHNSITIDGGIGQKDDDIDADGNIDMFVTQSDFDAAVGDATDSYDGKLDRFVRDIIYIRPNAYIIIDDLKASENKKNGSRFEWWLNAIDNISVHDDNKGATIKADNASLDARIQYPKSIKPFYSDTYSGPDLINYPTTEAYSSKKPQKRIWFETDKLRETKIVSTLNVRKTDSEPVYVKSTELEDCIKLEFEDGTIAYVSTTTDKTKEIIADGVEFCGDAVVFNDESIIFVRGTKLLLNGQTMVQSDRETTVTMGKGQIDISSNDDYKVKLKMGSEYLPVVKSLMDDSLIGKEPREINPLNGINYKISEDDGYIEFEAQKGDYSMLVNGAVQPGKKTGEKIGLDVTVDGETKHYDGDMYYNNDYEKVATIRLDLSGKFIIKGKSLGIKSDISVGDEMLLNGTDITLSGDENHIELETVKITDCNSEQVEDYEGLKSQLSAFVEAENYEKLNSMTARLSSSTSKANLIGITQLNNVNDSAEYKIEVKESGNYDLALRSAVWAEPLPVRSIKINNQYYKFTVPMTGGYGSNGPQDYLGVRVDSNIYLEAGEYKITVYAENNGTWNYDWIGLIKK